MGMPHELLLCFLFATGTIVGSFLNVVVYRLPRGGNLMFPGSRCPACGHDIRWYDNVPIVGWLWLGRQCRDCHVRISGRYPLVEFVVGVMFLAIGWTDWVRPESVFVEAQTAALAANPAIEVPPIGLEVYHLRFVHHLLLLCTLLAAALIDFDGGRFARQLITWPSAVGILIAIGWPAVQALPLVSSADPTTIHARFLALATSFVGMLTAVIIRLAVFRVMGFERARSIGLSSATLAIYAVGAFFGWQATLLVGVIAVLWALVAQSPRCKKSLGRVGPAMIVFFATTIWCLAESWIASVLHAR
ncbi:MAG TPA: prepilin peptidase [Pirellulales bacterium]|jgi:leader peptidase (prepilin peptidase)/N-methyltransferase